MLIGTNERIKSTLVKQIISNFYPLGVENKQDNGIYGRRMTDENNGESKQESEQRAWRRRSERERNPDWHYDIHIMYRCFRDKKSF